PDPGGAAVVPRPAVSQSAQPGAFRLVHCFERGTEASPRPGLHFHHHESAVLAGENVDLAVTAPPVALEDAHPVPGQIARGKLLAALAQCTALVRQPCSCAHPHHLPPLRWWTSTGRSVSFLQLWTTGHVPVTRRGRRAVRRTAP